MADPVMVTWHNGDPEKGGFRLDFPDGTMTITPVLPGDETWEKLRALGILRKVD